MKEEFNCNPRCTEQALERGGPIVGNTLVRRCGCKPPIQPRFEGEELLTDEDMMELTNYDSDDFKLDDPADLLEINNEPSDELLNELKEKEAFE